MSSCCQKEKSNTCCDAKSSVDFLFWGGFLLCFLGYVFHFQTVFEVSEQVSLFSSGVKEMVHQMWWGVLLGVFFVICLNRVPKAIIGRILGDGSSTKGILKATFAGVLLDLCNHGILMVASSLYKKGASTAQVMAFLVASPWNSFSLLFVLWALIGWQWTLAFTALSMCIAFITGLVFRGLENKNVLPQNLHTHKIEQETSLLTLVKKWLKEEKEQFSPEMLKMTIVAGVKDSKIVIKWLLVGVALASILRAVVHVDNFSTWFAPTFAGLMLTSFVATVIEVCSEGSVPLASDIFHTAAAPGNSFSFLMTGVSTDYTEVMILKETTGRWKIALFLPLVTLPQVLLISFLLNAL